MKLVLKADGIWIANAISAEHVEGVSDNESVRVAIWNSRGAVFDGSTAYMTRANALKVAAMIIVAANPSLTLERTIADIEEICCR